MAALLAAAAGCDRVDMNAQFVNEERLQRGLVVILPGIEGHGAANQSVRKGLYDADVPYALAIYSWGFPVPGIGLYVNQTATRIQQYRAKYGKDRPIYLVGHSGGGGVAIFTLEALAATGAEPVEGAFLLSASISANYPLGTALRMTRRGIVNVYNPEDELLNSGTAIFGNVDGGRGDTAGRTGFHSRHDKLFEKRITSRELGVAGDPHFIATNARLIQQHAPAWLTSRTWPPPNFSN
jgi:pimeloyl-ACP methyl ester carboxylesterase